MNRRTILHGVGALLLLALVVPFVVHAAPMVVGADHSYIILSGSMEPEMSPGDSVIVQERDPGSIEEGDVVTFKRSGSDTVVTHRVVDVREENGQHLFETKGDANDAADREPVPGSNVVGTVTLTIPLIGYVIHFVNSPIGFATLVLLPLGLLAVSEAWNFARDAIRTPDGVATATGAGDGTDPGSADRDRGRDASLAATGDGIPDGGASPGGTTTAPVRAGDPVPPVAIADDSTGGDEAPATAIDSETEESAEGVAVDATDLRATTAILVALVPYAAHVALQLQTLLTIAIAYTVGFTAFALVAMQAGVWVRERRERAEPNRSSIANPGDASAATGHASADPERGPASGEDAVQDDADRGRASEDERTDDVSEIEWPSGFETRDPVGEES